MKVSELSWMQVEHYLRDDDRVVLPLGSLEQHGYLSLATDALLAERVAVEAAEPLGVPVYPAVPFGLAPYFMAYPGTVTLRPATYTALLEDLLASLHAAGFHRVLLVSGHGGNAPAQAVAREWGSRHGVRTRFHEWWRAPRTRLAVEAEGTHGSHANWMESFPWTRVPGADPPTRAKPPVTLDDAIRLDPSAVRERLGDGSFGGAYAISDEAMERIWSVAVAETRSRLAGDWEDTA
jgi:creatinine amidohydrolase